METCAFAQKGQSFKASLEFRASHKTCKKIKDTIDGAYTTSVPVMKMAKNSSSKFFVYSVSIYLVGTDHTHLLIQLTLSLLSLS